MKPSVSVETRVDWLQIWLLYCTQNITHMSAERVLS